MNNEITERVDGFFIKYKKYKKHKSDVVNEIYSFLAVPVNIFKMINMARDNKPPIRAVVSELEERFKEKIDFKKVIVRQMIGSLIRDILSDYGFVALEQKSLRVTNSEFFNIASLYSFDENKVKRRIVLSVEYL